MFDKIGIFKQTFILWGETSQLDKTIEECSELIKAICKYKTKKTETTFNNIIEEIVDVKLMIENLLSHFDSDNKADEYEAIKLDRLIKIITNEINTIKKGGEN